MTFFLSFSLQWSPHLQLCAVNCLLFSDIFITCEALFCPVCSMGTKIQLFFCVFQFMCPTSEQQLAKCTVELVSLLGKSDMISYLRLKSVITVLLDP